MNVSSLPRLLGLVLVAMLLLLPSRPSRAQEPSADRAAAEALYRQGRGLMKEQKFAEACEKFGASQKLDAAVGTLLFLGECNERLDKKATALAAFQDAVALAAEKEDSKRQHIAEVRAAALAPQVSSLAIRVAAETKGLVIRRDGVVLPAEAWGAMLPVNAGDHQIEATAAGKKPWTRTVSVVDGGTELSVDVPELQDVGADATTATVSDDDDGVDTATALRVSGLVTAGVGLVGVVVGSVFGVMAGSSNDDSLQRCRTPSLCGDEGLTLRDDAQTQATVSTIGFVAGGVLVAAGLTLFFVAPSTEVEESEELALSLGAGPGDVGLRLWGSW